MPAGEESSPLSSSPPSSSFRITKAQIKEELGSILEDLFEIRRKIQNLQNRLIIEEKMRIFGERNAGKND